MALTNFAGAVAVITGGASGIGLATARALHARGAHVVLADINHLGLQQAEEQIRQHNTEVTGKILGMPTDVTNEQQVQALMRQTVDAFGRIDLAMTSAGIGTGGPIDTFTGSQMQNIMNINFMGTYHCVRAALPTMRKQESGHFVFLSSVAGQLGPPSLISFCAAKWGLRGFSTPLRGEKNSTSLRATTAYPALVGTPLTQLE